MKKKTLVLVCVFAVFINAVFCQNTQTNEKGIAAPNTFPWIQDGDELEFLKVTNDTNRVLANDTLVAVPGPPAMAASPNFSHATLTAYSFVDRRGENITIKADLGTNKWVVAAN